MLMTVLNSSGRTINTLDTLTGGSGISALLAVGGAKKDALPYPFAHIGPLANATDYQLPMHSSDWGFKPVPWLTETPAQQWNYMVQAGVVSLTFALEATPGTDFSGGALLAGVRDQEDQFLHLI